MAAAACAKVYLGDLVTGTSFVLAPADDAKAFTAPAAADAAGIAQISVQQLVSSFYTGSDWQLSPSQGFVLEAAGPAVSGGTWWVAPHATTRQPQA